MEAIWSFMTWVLIVMQMPAELPPQDSEGWPMPAFNLVIINERVGFTQRADMMADELWGARNEEGLWTNSFGYTDGANSALAVQMYEEVGQHDRAVETSRRTIEFLRANLPNGLYNPVWFGALSAMRVGDPVPLDLIALSAPGLRGEYAPGAGVTNKGKVYANVMAAHWRELGGPEFVPYEADWCPVEKGRAECLAGMHYAKGERFLPIMPGPYGFYTDGVLACAALMLKGAL